MDPVMAARPTVDAFSRANYLAAVANRVDSYWVPDHINGQTPRPLWDPKYTAAARILRSPDAAMDAWTLLGSLAARRRFTESVSVLASPTPVNATPPSPPRLLRR
jgi:phthiodiolone/phenolphthiodiolone dimycocerosates ketoreductase